jgi:polar amino acid transport system substrate-binding protein
MLGAIVVTVTLTALVGLGRAQSQPQSTLDIVKQRGVLLAGVRYDMPPYGYVEKEGSVTGIDIEIVKFLAQKLGVKHEFKQVTAKTRIPMLVNGNVDVLAAGLAHTIERDQVIDYTVTYLESGNLFMVKKGSPVRSYRDLGGKTVATIQGTAYADGLMKKQPSAKLLTFQEYPQAVLAIEQGKADALMADDTTLVSLLRGRAGLELVGDIKDFPRWFIGLGVRQNDSKWRNFLNHSLMEMWEKGLLQKVVSESGFTYDPCFEVEVWKF